MFSARSQKDVTTMQTKLEHERKVYTPPPPLGVKKDIYVALAAVLVFSQETILSVLLLMLECLRIESVTAWRG